jgi:hypothetical protein
LQHLLYPPDFSNGVVGGSSSGSGGNGTKVKKR